MPRYPRHLLPPGVYHVVARGTGGILIFVDSFDYERFVSFLSKVARREGWDVMAYCLMPNHFHLVVDAPGSLSTGMQWLNGVYARRFNARHSRRGHLFQDRFWSGAIETDDLLTVTCDYVLNNALTAGLCARAGDWAWRGGSVVARAVR